MLHDDKDVRSVLEMASILAYFITSYVVIFLRPITCADS